MNILAKRKSSGFVYGNNIIFVVLFAALLFFIGFSVSVPFAISDFQYISFL